MSDNSIIRPDVLIKANYAACEAYDAYDPEAGRANAQAMGLAIDAAWKVIYQEIAWKMRMNP